MSNKDPVIRDWDSLRYAGPDPPFHLLLPQRASSAVNDQLVGGHVLRKFGAGSELKLRFGSGMFSDPCRQLLRAYVTARLRYVF